MPAGLNDKQELFAILIAEGGQRPADVASDPRIDVCTATAYNWLKKAEVRDRINEIMHTHRLRALLLIGQQLDKAVNTITDAMTNKDATPTMLNAAKTVLQAYGVLLSERTDKPQEKTVINIEVSTEFNENMAQEQRARAHALKDGAIPATFILEE